MTTARVPRPMCDRCERPISVCYCSALTSLETKTKVVILQHPREHGNPIGTAHMAHLCLPQSSVHVGMEWDASDAFVEACSDPTRPAALLYPGDDARDVLLDPPDGPVTLIVLDGTWSQAHATMKRNPRLAALPRFSFEPPEPTAYRIRSEPCGTFVSTLEALMHVLGALEGDAEKFRALRRPMDWMIDRQLEAEAREGSPRPFPRPRPKLAPFDRLPVAIRERYDDLVLVFADSSTWPYDTPQSALGSELVRWCAYRPSTGEMFASTITPRHPLAPKAHVHTELSVDELLSGESPAAFLERFAAFARPTDVIGSWGVKGVRLFEACGGVLPGTFVHLRQAARVLTNAKNGTLEEYAAATITTPLPPLPAGRAGRRLGMLIGIVEAWRQLPREAAAEVAERSATSE